MFYPHTTLTLTLTPSHPHTPTLPARKHPACRGFYGWVSDSIGRAQKKLLFTGSIAMLHCWCNYAEPLVFLCWTFGTRMLYSSGTTKTVGIPMLDCWYSYAEPLVFLCWTFGTRMLYSSGTVFSICLQAISKRKSEWRNEVRRPKGKPMKNCRPLAD